MLIGACNLTVYPVRGAQVPNTRDEPSDAVDEKIMAWGQNLKELSKETKLKLEKDANADEEVGFQSE